MSLAEIGDGRVYDAGLGFSRSEVLFMRLVSLAMVALVSACAIARGAEVSGDEILAKVRPVHPRLMMTKERLGALKEQLAVDPWLKGRYAARKKEADQLLSEPESKYEIPDGLRLLATSRRVLERVTTLAVVYRVEGDQKYLDRCWKELDAAAHFPDWNPRHFLDTGEMTAAFGLGYDWLYDAWTPQQREEIRGAIEKMGLKPAIDVYTKRYSWWPSWENNWNAVCNGGIAIGALAIAGDASDAGPVKRVLGEGVKSAPLALKQFAPDGAWYEGPGYWGYMTLFESMYLDSLQTACGTDFGLGDIPGVEKGGWFPAYMNGPAGGAYNFADAGEGPGRPTAGPQLLWMARRFHEPRYAQYQVDFGSVGGRLDTLEMVWGPGIERKPWNTIDLDRYFRRTEVATMRDSWTDKNGWFVGFKAGANNVSHAHLDVGSFILEAKGVRWVIDPGADNYNVPGYFDATSGRRWLYYRLRAEGHAALVINPTDRPDQDPKGSGKVTSFESTAGGVKLTADLTGVYPAAEKVTRELAFSRGRNLVVSDHVQLKKEGEVYWFFPTKAAVKVSEDGKELTLSQKGKTLGVALLGPAGARFEVGPAEPLATSPHPKEQAVNKGVSRVAVHLAGVKEADIRVKFGE